MGAHLPEARGRARGLARAQPRRHPGGRRGRRKKTINLNLAQQFHLFVLSAAPTYASCSSATDRSMGIKKLGVPLKEQPKPLDLPDEVLHKQLANEFHVRYLESIGASPTPANMAMARKEMPIDSCKFTTAWKSRGWSADYVYISPQLDRPSGATAKNAVAILPHGGALQDLQAKLLQPLQAGASHAPVRAEEASKEEVDGDAVPGAIGAPKGPMRFADAQEQFLYPFKREGPAAAAAAAAAALAASPRRRTGGGELDADGQGPALDATVCGADAGSSGPGQALPPLPEIAARFATRDALTYARYPAEEVLAELQKTLSVHTKEIVSLQTEFVQNFPFDKIRERLSDGEMRVALDELSSKRTTRFIGLVALFLYWTHLAPLAQRQISDDQLSTLYCAVQQYFTSARERLKTRRATLLVVLPALLLLVRVSVEAVYRHAFPKWWTTIEGQATLAEMDASIERIFDPNAYLSHIAPLESTTAAIRIAARESQGLKSNDRRKEWWATSALVSSALPGSRVVRRQGLPSGMVGGGRGVLTNQARQQLYASAVRRAETSAARRYHSGTAVSSLRRDPGVDGPLLTQSASLKDLVQRRSRDQTEEEGTSPTGDQLASRHGGSSRMLKR